MEAGFFKLLNEVWRDLHDPAILWELLALAICMALAGWTQWRLRHRTGRLEGTLHAAEVGLRRIMFPVTALLLVLLLASLMAG